MKCWSRWIRGGYWQGRWSKRSHFAACPVVYRTCVLSSRGRALAPVVVKTPCCAVEVASAAAYLQGLQGSCGSPLFTRKGRGGKHVTGTASRSGQTQMRLRCNYIKRADGSQKHGRATPSATMARAVVVEGVNRRNKAPRLPRPPYVLSHLSHPTRASPLRTCYHALRHSLTFSAPSSSWPPHSSLFRLSFPAVASG